MNAFISHEVSDIFESAEASDTVVAFALIRIGSRIGGLVSPLQTISHSTCSVPRTATRVMSGKPPTIRVSRKSPVPDGSFTPRDPAAHTNQSTGAILAGGERSVAPSLGEYVTTIRPPRGFTTNSSVIVNSTPMGLWNATLNRNSVLSVFRWCNVAHGSLAFCVRALSRTASRRFSQLIHSAKVPVKAPSHPAAALAIVSHSGMKSPLHSRYNQRCFLGSTCRVSVCPQPLQVSVCTFRPITPKIRSSSTAVTFIGSSQSGHGSPGFLAGFASSAATRSSSSRMRFGMAVSVFQTGT